MLNESKSQWVKKNLFHAQRRAIDANTCTILLMICNSLRFEDYFLYDIEVNIYFPLVMYEVFDKYTSLCLKCPLFDQIKPDTQTDKWKLMHWCHIVKNASIMS